MKRISLYSSSQHNKIQKCPINVLHTVSINIQEDFSFQLKNDHSQSNDGYFSNYICGYPPIL